MTVITTFNNKGLEQYGRESIRSFISYWPETINLVVYSEGFTLEDAARVQCYDLNTAAPRLVTFKNHYGKQPMANGHTTEGYNYNFDAVRFSHKMFAMFAAAGTLETDYLVWLDGDVITHQSVPDTLIPEMMDGYFAAYLGRKGKHSETGFLCFDMRHQEVGAFFETMERVYLSGELFKLNAWHDSEVFDVTRTIFEAQGKIKTHDLSADLFTADPFSECQLSEFMNHRKGQPKTTESPVPVITETMNNPQRYGQILDLIRTFKPATLVEVGTWNGQRAIEMASAALQGRQQVTYRGYDLFELATSGNDKDELNGKSWVKLTEVDEKLANFKASQPGFSFHLVRGSSLEALTEQAVDFCYIDGGHAVETIAQDFSKLRESEIIVFDDYYLNGVDIEAFGCNKVIEALPHLLLPIVDRFSSGLAIALAVVAKPEKLSEIGRVFPQAIRKNT
ncbi:class I SAM-dependent methyltransferase [Nisaea sp.]|uniref:class I SAM-dependent methyltransferase n=1 Tax=Nisaea sp. TaxID=2024842 RepID=UPI002B26A121|nr:class I SAM-dependent methyltransferase [Nisaea sp.]